MCGFRYKIDASVEDNLVGLGRSGVGGLGARGWR